MKWLTSSVRRLLPDEKGPAAPFPVVPEAREPASVLDLPDPAQTALASDPLHLDAFGVDGTRYIVALVEILEALDSKQWARFSHSVAVRYVTRDRGAIRRLGAETERLAICIDARHWAEHHAGSIVARHPDEEFRVFLGSLGGEFTDPDGWVAPDALRRMVVEAVGHAAVALALFETIDEADFLASWLLGGEVTVPRVLRRGEDLNAAYEEGYPSAPDAAPYSQPNSRLDGFLADVASGWESNWNTVLQRTVGGQGDVLPSRYKEAVARARNLAAESSHADAAHEAQSRALNAARRKIDAAMTGLSEAIPGAEETEKMRIVTCELSLKWAATAFALEEHLEQSDFDALLDPFADVLGVGSPFSER